MLITGKLHIRDWDNGERAGTSVEIEADHIGHDLMWGSAAFTRTVLVAETDPVDEPESESENSKGKKEMATT